MRTCKSCESRLYYEQHVVEMALPTLTVCPEKNDRCPWWISRDNILKTKKELDVHQNTEAFGD